MTAERRRSHPRTVVQAVVGLGLAAFLLVWGLPHFGHTTWGAVWHILRQVPPATDLVMVVGVMVGLYCYTLTLTGSMPGLRHWQALVVNVAGSAVGNLLPGGGAVGLAATYTICRSWGFSRRDISTSAIVTGVWNVLSRIALPLLTDHPLSRESSNHVECHLPPDTPDRAGDTPTSVAEEPA